ncbi:hypothetical protein K7432_011369 [Basidiobolus ranarum]|uniref:GSKIP domain-containing protein n=1 Tax=Basidiobolus ranarum TaxID=34480 RepID=A0ABR2WMD7_9FUNG
MKVGAYSDRVLVTIRQIQNFIDLESLEILQLNGYLEPTSITRISKITLRTLEGIKLTIEINYVGLKIIEVIMPEAEVQTVENDLQCLVGRTYDTMNTLLSYVSPLYKGNKSRDEFNQDDPSLCLDR